MTAPLFSLVGPMPTAPRPPLLVLLHGFGSHEEDLFTLADAFDPRFLLVSVRAPLTLGAGSYAWFPTQFTPAGPVADTVQAESSRRLLLEFLAWAEQNWETAPGATLVGFSQGAIMAASLALTEPQRVRAAVLMSGRILPEVLPAAAPDRLALTEYLIVHGTQDQVLPIAHGRQSREVLRSLGIEPAYQEFPMGHTISDESLALVADWTRDR